MSEVIATTVWAQDDGRISRNTRQPVSEPTISSKILPDILARPKNPVAKLLTLTK